MLGLWGSEGAMSWASSTLVHQWFAMPSPCWHLVESHACAWHRSGGLFSYWVILSFQPVTPQRSSASLQMLLLSLLSMKGHREDDQGTHGLQVTLEVGGVRPGRRPSDSFHWCTQDGMTVFQNSLRACDLTAEVCLRAGSGTVPESRIIPRSEMPHPKHQRSHFGSSSGKIKL